MPALHPSMRILVLIPIFYSTLINCQNLTSLWGEPLSKRPLPYTNLREADITWGKRVWRTIDLREKLNHPLRYPLAATNKKSSLFDVLKNALKNQAILPIRINEDEFYPPIPKDSILKILVKKKILSTKDEFNNEYARYIIDTIRSEEIFQYYIIEDYFFDAKRSVMDSRIRAVCPVWYNKITEQMEPLFWVNYDDCRNILVSHTAMNSKNDARKISFDDLFNKRMYGSFITKESNIFDREIKDYSPGIEALYEAERVKQSIYNFESDFWQY